MSAARCLRALCLVLLLAGCGGGSEASRQKARLALDFQPNAVHAGVLAAQERGAIEVRVPSASTDSLKLLLAGRVDASIVDIQDFGLALERGEDLVAVGAVAQRPLAAVIARGDIRRPRDLRGKRVGVTGVPSDEAVLRAVLRSDGLSLNDVRPTTIGFSAVPSLAAGKVDAVVTFWNAEGVALRRRGVRTKEFRVDGFGAPRYPELVVVTKRSTLRDRPGAIHDLRLALAAGTREALRDPDAAIRRVAERSGSKEALVRAQFNAVAPALRPPLSLDRSALEAWGRFAVRFGILGRAPDIERAFASF